MTKFITLPYSGSKAHIALWEEAADGTLKVLSVHREIDEIEGFEDLETFRFDRQTSFDTGLPTNGGNYPAGDADGKPFWIGCRISFRIASHYINTVAGEGTFKNVDMYGGVSFVSDTPLNVHDRNGAIVDKRQDQYDNLGTYQTDGPYKGFVLMAKKLGDRHEHGQTDLHFRVIDDPRSVCELMPKNTSTRHI